MKWHLQRMVKNLNDPRLKNHYLDGQLASLHACAIAYNCRMASRNRNIQKPVRESCYSSTSARKAMCIEGIHTCIGTDEPLEQDGLNKPLNDKTLLR